MLFPVRCVGNGAVRSCDLFYRTFKLDPRNRHISSALSAYDSHVRADTHCVEAFAAARMRLFELKYIPGGYLNYLCDIRAFQIGLRPKRTRWHRRP